MKFILLANILFLNVSCVLKNRVEVTFKNLIPANTVTRASLGTTVSSVSVVNNQLLINGSHLDLVTVVSLQGGAVNETFSIETKTASQIIANGVRNISIASGSLFNLILSSADAAATYQVTFNVQNGGISAAMLSSMGATKGQVMKYNGSSWVPSSVTNAQIYLGTWNAVTNSPDLSSPSNVPGDYYIVSTGGVFGGVTYAIGDWIISDGYNWQRVPNSQSIVSSFQNRRGIVTLVPGDYVSLKNGSGKLTNSSLNDLADVDTTGIGANKILKYDGSKWIIASEAAATPAAGSITVAELANSAVTYAKTNFTDGDIPQAKVNGLVTSLATINSSLSGLSTANVTEGANLYYTNARVLAAPMTGLSTTTATAVAATDTLLQGLGKIQGQLNNKLNTSAFVDWAGAGVQTIDPTRLNLATASRAVVTTAGGQLTASSTTAAQVGYLSNVTSDIQAQIDAVSSGSSPWTVASADVYRASGKVGIGTSTIGSTLTVKGTTTDNTASALNITNSVGSSLLYVRNDGRVSIGNTSPGGLFEVQANSPSQIYTLVYNSGAGASSTIFTSAGSLTQTIIGSSGGADTLGNGTHYGSAVFGSQSYASTHLITNNAARLTILPTGAVGIGLNNPSYTLEVNGSIAGTSAYNNLSDMRLKKDIVKIPDALSKLLTLDGVFYNFKTKDFPDRKLSNRREMGVIAQRVEKVFPEAVSLDKRGFRSVAYSMLIAPLIEAVKEIHKHLIGHDEVIQEQKREIAALKKENQAIRNYLCTKDKSAAICH